MDKRVAGPGSTHKRHKLHGHLIHILGGPRNQLDKGIVWIRARRRVSTQVGDLDIAEAMFIEMSA